MSTKKIIIIVVIVLALAGITAGTILHGQAGITKVATGKVVRHHAFARHILTSKASKRKRKLALSDIVSPANAPAVRLMLPYGLQ